MLIATLSPASDCLDETVSTLRFADRAHQVMTFVSKNEKRPVDHALVQRLQSEVARLRVLLEERGIGSSLGSSLSASIGALSTAGVHNNDPAPFPAAQSAAHLTALSKLQELATENNSLRRRLGMPEVPVSSATSLAVSHPRLTTPQRHTPRGFAIVGGGNSETANALRGGSSGGGQESEGTKAELNLMRG